MCNYCGIPNHSRAACRARLRDVDKGITRQSHPAKGTFTSGNKGRQDPQSKIVNTADQWGDTWMAPQTPQRGQGIQWPTTQPNTPAPVTLTITDPEDAKWLAQAASSGLDPTSVITACRQRQQHYSRSQATNDHTPQTPQVSSSLSPLPSGLVACNECAHVSATFELADRHQKEAHSRLANGPDCRN